MSAQTDFIASIYWPAKDISDKTGLSLQTMLAQAAQETGWGAKVLPGTNNIFNIKADSSWKGATVTVTVPEYINGTYLNVPSKFRVYESVEAALLDRVNFLQSNPRYSSLFQQGTLGNFEREAITLQTSGYATDPKYATNLISVFGGKTMQSSIDQAWNSPPIINLRK